MGWLQATRLIRKRCSNRPGRAIGSVFAKHAGTAVCLISRPIYDVRLIGFKCTGRVLLWIFAWFDVQTHDHCNVRVLDAFGGSDSADTQFGLEICAAKGVEETGLLRDGEHLARGFIALGGLQVDMRLDRIGGSWLAGAA